MSIPMDAFCYQCHMGRTLETARSLGDEATATAFLKELLKVYASFPEDAASPLLAPATNALLQRFYGVEQDRFRQEKIDANQFVLARLEDIYCRVQSAPDSLYAALQFAVLGNYIDFSALQGQVSFETLDNLLDTAQDISLDMPTYQQFCADLSGGKRLLYLTDNAGEICFDRVLAEEIQKRYPHLEITFCVRGGPVSNDATREDAITAGINFPVIDNGNTVGGTVLSMLSQQAKDALESADVIIAKGMGNAETLLGCGYNVYYVFLVKCQRFISYFQKPKMTPMLLRERSP